MSSHKVPCRAVGRILSFEAADFGEVKRLWLATSGGEVQVKIPKPQRFTIQQSLPPGSWVEVIGYQKWEGSELKIKAAIIVPTSPRAGDWAEVPVPQPTASPQRQPEATAPKLGSIQVCQKSDCCKRGGTAIWAVLEAELERRGLSEQVKLRGTGCMKQCKAGPNVVFLPDKAHYSSVKPQQIFQLLEQHFNAASLP